MRRRFLTGTPQSLLRVALLVVLAMVLAITCFSLFTAWRTRVAWVGTAAVPFTLEVEDYVYQGNPQDDLASRRITARRSDGTTATVTTMFPGRPTEHTIRVIKYLDGRGVQLIDALAAKTTWPPPPTKYVTRSAERLRQAPQNCVFADHEIFVRRDAVLGHKADVVSTSFTTTVWRVPDLGCEAIQSRQGHKHQGGFKLLTETKAISLKPGEPDPRLFDEGAEYAELKPSELLRRDTARVGIPWNNQLEQEAERADKIYLAAY